LQYLGDSPQDYENATVTAFDQQFLQYELVNGPGGFEDLIQVLQVLNQTSNEDFETAIQQVFDVERFLRLFALEICTGHLDDYARTGNNYAMFHNMETGLFEVLYTSYREICTEVETVLEICIRFSRKVCNFFR
jgi:spore coat protein CotH